MNQGADYRMAKIQQQRLHADAGSKTSRVLTGTLMGVVVLALTLLGVFFLTGCGLPVAPAMAEAAAQETGQVTSPAREQAANRETPPRAADESSYLQQALAHIPAGPRRFAFTHWSRVHTYNGFHGNSQETDRDVRVAYMLNVMKQSQPAAQLDSTHFLFQAQNWGWDSTDLVWEAEAEWEQITDSVHLLQFRHDFDFAPLLQRLQQRGFASSDYGGVTIYTVPLSESPDWHYRSHLAHHTFAFLADGLVVMAPTPPAVKRVLDVRGHKGKTLAVQPHLAPLLPELAQMMAAEIQFGTATCAVYGRSGASLSAYSLLATGHRAGGERQRDTLFLVYSTAGPASTDFEARRDFLHSGASAQRETVYGQVLDVQEASIDGRVLKFDMSPTAELRERPGWPQTLVGWVQDGDALFAGCGTARDWGFCRVANQRAALPAFPESPHRTTHDRFRITSLSSKF